jgi:hypothetical protein
MKKKTATATMTEITTIKKQTTIYYTSAAYGRMMANGTPTMKTAAAKTDMTSTSDQITIKDTPAISGNHKARKKKTKVMTAAQAPKMLKQTKVQEDTAEPRDQQ